MNKNLFGFPQCINLDQVFSKQTIYDLFTPLSCAKK